MTEVVENVLLLQHADTGIVCFVNLGNFVQCHHYSIDNLPVTKTQKCGKNKSQKAQH